MFPSAVVTFAGARDNYQLPLALDEAGWLRAFVTDMYWPVGQPWFDHTLGKLIPRELIRARSRKGLDSRKVKISWKAWIAALMMQIRPRSQFLHFHRRVLGDKARSVAARTHSPVFASSYCGFDTFTPSRAREQPPAQRFIFQVHPHPRTVRRLLLEELDRAPWAEASLRAEVELSWPEDEYEKLCREPALANGWAAASTFTARSLAENGVPEANVQVIPYGVAHEEFPRRDCVPASNSTFTVVFVGSMVQRKGLFDLLEAARLLRSRNIRVLLLGRGYIDEALLVRYSALNIHRQTGLPRTELIRMLHECDLLALPSIVEGFGHVILEAMACGLPVITTPNTCGPDILRDGVDGFIVPIRSPEAIAERLEWGSKNRAQLSAMGDAAAQRAGQFTWENFRAGVREAYRKMVVLTR